MFKHTFVVAALLVSALAIPAPDAGVQPFTKQNGEDAIALNDKFTSLTANSPCTAGEDACVGAQFAQCVNGAFVLTDCGAGTTCVALPLVNKPGTSVTCSTEADKDARIAATGASTASSGGSDATSTPATPAPASSDISDAAAAAPGAKSFTLQNGKDAQALNAKFQGLTSDSSCTDGEDACINSQFAQCANGKFVLTPCATGTTCAALPLVNKAGTSVTCDTQGDAQARIAATGAGNSLTGN